jgi:mono/diheme cytochrome c family protein
MMDRGQEPNLRLVPAVVYGLAGASATALIVGLVAFAAPQPADALPAYAKQTGLACGRCHVNPAGGGARTSFGNAFLANGHKLPSKEAKPGKPGTNSGASAPPAAAPAAAPTVVSEGYARAQAWSLRHPYYSHFLYDSCDYGNCTTPK